VLLTNSQQKAQRLSLIASANIIINNSSNDEHRNSPLQQSQYAIPA
jgi:hypothetical protein